MGRRSIITIIYIVSILIDHLGILYVYMAHIIMHDLKVKFIGLFQFHKIGLEVHIMQSTDVQSMNKHVEFAADCVQLPI